MFLHLTVLLCSQQVPWWRKYRKHGQMYENKTQVKINWNNPLKYFFFKQSNLSNLIIGCCYGAFTGSSCGFLTNLSAQWRLLVVVSKNTVWNLLVVCHTYYIITSILLWVMGNYSLVVQNQHEWKWENSCTLSCLLLEYL